MQVGTRLSSSVSTPAAWQSVGHLVGSVLANVKIEKTAEFDRPRLAAKPSPSETNDQGR
ncbi:MAG: hypothetical protein JXQ99_17800 [Hyphomicrobiaceae bacterium]